MGKYVLTTVERQVLLRKYMKLGNSFEYATKKISTFSEYLKDLKHKLKQRNIPKEDINKRFKAEFEKMCQSLDAGCEYLDKLKGGRNRYGR